VGRFTAPAQWKQLHEAATTLDAWGAGSGEPDVTPREATAALERAAITSVRSAALAGRKLPDTPMARFTAAYRALADPLEREARAAVFEGALAGADGGLLVELRRAVSDGFEQFVFRALRPAHEAAMHELKAAGALVGHVEDRGAEELDGIDGGRQTWDRIAHELLPRYHAIHEAHRAAWTIAVEPTIGDAGLRHDRETQLSYRNRYELQPDLRTGQAPAMPEAVGPLALWLSTVAQPWLPILSDFEQLDADRREAIQEQAREATRRTSGRPREADPTAAGPRCTGCGRPVEFNGFGWIDNGGTGIDCDQSVDGLHHADADDALPRAKVPASDDGGSDRAA
jgi:hypothetical protein